MEEKYYAVERTGDHLAHYGVRGMKWGVTKATAKNSDRLMKKAYKRADKRLRKLQKKADLNIQSAKVKVQGRKALRSGLVTAGIGGLGALGVAKGLKTGSLKPVYGNRLGDPHVTYEGKGTPMNALKDKKLIGVSVSREADGYGLLGSAAGTIAGLGKTAYHTGKAIAAKHRTTKKGHAKAVAKANAWKNEMNKAFAGTKYASGQNNNRHGKKRRNNA